VILPSVLILKEKSEKFITKNYGAEVHHLTTGSLIPPKKPEQIIDIVFYADAFISLLTSQLWDEKTKFRFWTYSQVFRRILTDIVGLPANTVGVLPRYQLIEKHRKTHNPDECRNIVVVTRLDAQKNLEITFAVLSLLQRKSQLQDKELIFCGQAPLEQLRSLVKRNEWIKPPKILGDIGTNWHHKIAPSVYLSLSTYRYEDFSVAAAQAQSSGFPIIASRWGGFIDIDGAGLVEVSNIWKARESEKHLEQLGCAIMAAIKSGHHVSDSKIEAKIPIEGSQLIHQIAKLDTKTYSMLRGFFEAGGFPENHSYFKPIATILSGN
jgi:glycosyltransferase involved in cell wall biosynthesis